MYMTQTGIKNREIETNRDIADKDRSQRERASRRSAAATVVSSALKGVMPAMMGNPSNLYTNVGEGVAKSIANIPSFYDYGMVIDNVLAVISTPNERGYIPQVFALPFLPTIGYQPSGDAALNPINVGATRQQSILREANSRIGEYDPGDLLQVELASLEVMSALEYAKRVLQCGQVRTTANNMLAKLLVQAHGFLYSDISSHYKDYIGRLNLLIDKANTNIVLPKSLPLAARRIMLARYLIKDGAEDNRQIVVPCQVGFGYYSETDAAIKYDDSLIFVGAPGVVDATMASSNFADFGDFLSHIEKMISYLMYSKVLVTMYADLRAVLKTNIVQVDPIQLGEQPQFVLSTDLGDQIRNGSYWDVFVNEEPIDGPINTSALDIKQDASGFIYQGFNQQHPDTTSYFHPGGTTQYNAYDEAYIPIVVHNTGGSAVSTKLGSIEGYSKMDMLLNLDNESITDDLIEPFLFKYEARCFAYVPVGKTDSVMTLCVRPRFTETPLAFIPLVPDEDSGTFDSDSDIVLMTHTALCTVNPKDVSRKSAYAEAFGYHPMYTQDFNFDFVNSYVLTINTPVHTDWHNPVFVPWANLANISRMVCISLLQIINFTDTFRTGEQVSKSKSSNWNHNKSKKKNNKEK